MNSPPSLPPDTPLDALGLDPADEAFSQVVDEDLADEAVDLGFTTGGPEEGAGEDRVARLRDRLAASPDIAWADAVEGPVSVGRWLQDRRLVVVHPEAPGTTRWQGGTLHDTERMRLLLPGDEEAWVSHLAAAGRTVIHLDRTRLRVWWSPSGESNLELLSPGQDDGPAPDLGEIPSPESVFPGLLLQPWLDEASASLARSPSLVDRGAALGLVARLQRPDRPEEALQRELADPATAPPGMLLAWVSSGSSELLSELQLQAEADAIALSEGLSGVLEELAGHEDPRDLRALALARDRMESVLLLLSMAGRGDTLGRLLQALDRQVLLDAPLASFEALDDDQLWAVARNEPEAWWGSQLVSRVR